MTTNQDARFDIFIPGKPAPQGSKRHVGKGVMVEASPRTKPWRDLIVTMCLDKIHAGADTFVGPVEVHAVFRFARPMSHYGSGANTGILKPGAPLYPRTVGDIDKLCRALLDSLGYKHGAGVIADDADVVRLVADKHYATDLYKVGAYITVTAARPL